MFYKPDRIDRFDWLNRWPVGETIRSPVKIRFGQKPVKPGQLSGWTGDPVIEPVIDPSVHSLKKKFNFKILDFKYKISLEK